MLHMVGCLWFAVGVDNTSISMGWVSKQEWDDDIPNTTRWLTSLYWALTTISTVGYGDITAGTNVEMIYTLFAMILGMALNAWLIANLTKHLARSTLLEDAHDNRISTIVQYMNTKRIPGDLQTKVLDYMDIEFTSERGLDIHRELEKLPPALEAEMLDVMFIKNLRYCQGFHGVPEHVLVELSKAVSPYPVKKGQAIFAAGQVAREVFLLQSGMDGGTASVRLEKMIKQTAAERAEDPDKGEWRVDPAYKSMILTCSDATGTETLMFGEEALDFKTEGQAEELVIKRTFTATALTDGHLILIDASEVERIHNSYPTAGVERNVQYHHQTALRLMKRDRNEMVIDSDDIKVVCDMMEPHIEAYLHELQGTKSAEEVRRPQEALLLEIRGHKKTIAEAANDFVAHDDEQEGRIKQLEDAQGRIEAGESSLSL
jgi:CRP-like cAMP-binding protein